MKRIEFYEKKKNVASYPPESCISYLNRKIITHEPHPYYSDFKMNNNNSTKISYLAVTFEIKRRYGYAKRIERKSKASNTNPKSLANSTASERYEEGQMRIKSSLRPSTSCASSHMLSPANSQRSVSAYKMQSRRGTFATGDRTSSKVFPGPSCLNADSNEKLAVVV